MKDSITEEAARRFADEWKGRGYEKGETQMSWLPLLRLFPGMACPEISDSRKASLTFLQVITMANGGY